MAGTAAHVALPEQARQAFGEAELIGQLAERDNPDMVGDSLARGLDLEAARTPLASVGTVHLLGALRGGLLGVLQRQYPNSEERPSSISGLLRQAAS